MVGVKFDEKNKLWTCMGELECWDQNVSFGQMLLDTISDHGSKTAQVSALILSFYDKISFD